MGHPLCSAPIPWKKAKKHSLPLKEHRHPREHSKEWVYQLPIWDLNLRGAWSVRRASWVFSPFRSRMHVLPSSFWNDGAGYYHHPSRRRRAVARAAHAAASEMGRIQDSKGCEIRSSQLSSKHQAPSIKHHTAGPPSIYYSSCTNLWLGIGEQAPDSLAWMADSCPPPGEFRLVG